MTRKELNLILEEGEGYKIEFKESATGLDREMVAFANSSGGRIFLGVTDEKKPVGIKITNRLKSQIQDIANNCRPAVKVLFHRFEDILILEIREGDDKPHQCSSGFYTRVGPNSQKLTRDEILQFIKDEGKIRFGELILPKYDFEESFDPKKLSRFLKLAGISETLDAPTTLVNLGVAEKQEGRVILNNAGILFFSEDLDKVYFHTAVTCALFKGTEKMDILDRRDFNEDLVSSIDRAMNFLKQYIPVRYEMTGGPRRREVPEIPYDALREAIINAVTHRDYFEKGANVMVEMYDDRIEITNPGGLPRGLKPEDFGKKSVLRNPNIANLLQRIGYIEKMGTGITKMQNLVKEAGLGQVEFQFDTFFAATFRRPTSRSEQPEVESLPNTFGANFGIKFGIKGRRVSRLATILDWLNREQAMTAAEMGTRLKVSTRTIEKDLGLLRSLELIEFRGPKKTGSYCMTKIGHEVIEELVK